VLGAALVVTMEKLVMFSLPTKILLAKLASSGGDKDLRLRRAEGDTPPETNLMSTPYLALLIGGVLPACLWAITAMLQKLSAQHNLGPGPFLVAFGAMVLAAGLALSVLQRGADEWSWIGVRYAVASGLTYAIATGLISYALLSFGVPISKLAPVLGCNVLITVLLGVFLLGEGAGLNIWKAVGGTATVMLGLALVTSA
jgi:drug/metabolite transporter (DMT)-like permease